MASDVRFVEVPEFLETNGWVLQRIDEPYRVFIKGDSLPILVHVTSKRVSRRDFERIKQIVRKEAERDQAGD